MLILYTTEDGKSEIPLQAKDQTVWLSQREMGQLFDLSTDNVGPHLKNIYEAGESDPAAITEESSVDQFCGATKLIIHRTGCGRSSITEASPKWLAHETIWRPLA